MKLNSAFFALCFGFLLFAACKKTDDSSNNNNNSSSNLSDKAKLLVAGKWQITGDVAITNYMGKDTTVDNYVAMDACKKDNFITFAADGTCAQDEGANLCPGKSQISNATWKLLDNDARLAIYDSNPDTSDISELISTEMKLKYSYVASGGNTVYETLTLKNIK